MALRFNGERDTLRRVMAEEGRLALHATGNLGRGGAFRFRPYRKTSMTYALRMDQPFEVNTLEGTMTGQPGDWLAIGPEGEMYPIAASVFDASYVGLHEDNDE